MNYEFVNSTAFLSPQNMTTRIVSHPSFCLHGKILGWS